MLDALEAIGLLLLWLFLAFIRLLWRVVKLIVVVAVIVGAGYQIFAHAPANWPPFVPNVGTLVIYLSLAFKSAANAWLPLAVAAVFLWTFGTQASAQELKTGISQVRLAVIALMNYLDLDVETEGIKELRDKGVLKSAFDAWKMNFGLWLLTGKVDDDTLTSKPTRLHSGSSITLSEDIKRLVDEALERRGYKRV